jgi:HD-like signal output (HDOD) protein
MPTNATIKPTVGHFEIVRTLGPGATGSTRLARDPRLDRMVVLKTVAWDPRDAGGSGTASGPSVPGRPADGLAHPNLVTLHDAVEDAGRMLLVFEYAEGQTLDAVLAQRTRLPLDETLAIGIGLCRGLAHAHDRHLAHGDIRASQVMIAPDGVARLMNVAVRVASAQPAAAALDVRAVAALLQQMLTGTSPPAGAASAATASEDAASIDPRLRILLDRALLDASPAPLTTAAQLGDALDGYRQPAPDETAVAGSQATLDYLLRRIRLKGDFPALSDTISAVNRAAASDRAPVGVLCNSILKDIALTGRLLKIVNGSHLNQFGGSISTVSRAVAILGYDAVRNVAMSLALFEHMHDRANAVALKDQVVRIYFSGLLARAFAAGAGLQDAEQAFVCAMFHRLGKLLATFYLHEEAQIVQRHMNNKGWAEERASREVLGLSYEDLGVGVARAWNLPDEIVESMRGFTGHARKSPGHDVDRLRMVSGLANELADIVQETDEAKRKLELAQLVRRYGPPMGVSERSLVAAVETSAAALARDAESLSRGMTRSPFLRSAGSWLLVPERAVTAAQDGTPAVGDAAADDQGVLAQLRAETGAAPMPPASSAQGQRQAALTAGMQEITDALVGDHALNDVLRIILETMYRAIGFQRVMLFTLDPREQALRCRFGFGADADLIVQKRIAVPLHGARDLFYAAVVMGADLCIDDLETEKIRPHVPPWYKAALGARGVVLLPIVNRKRTLGLIYADSETPSALRFSTDEFNLLKTMRNQALLAMRQGT